MTGKRIITGSIYRETEPPDTELATTELTVKNTMIATMSSNTAIGSNVLVTGPFAWNSFTMDKAGAGG